jgi:hypothetical protein
LRGIKDWRTDDANGEQNDLPALSKGKLKGACFPLTTFRLPVYCLVWRT